MISRSFERPERTAKRANDTSNRYRMRHIGPQDVGASCLVNAHDHILGTHRANAESSCTAENLALGIPPHPAGPPPTTGLARRPTTAPTRSEVTWSLRSQAAVACDFATIETVTLRRFYLLFFIDIPTRTVYFAGITDHPTGVWTTQAARNLLLRHGHQLADARALVRDRGSTTIFWAPTGWSAKPLVSAHDHELWAPTGLINEYRNAA